uniref:Chromatin modification-related protein MEAF6 n=1 Tax=Chromera velia CCMP2878 TaxID=1169474 RepID=A0A0G4IA74_9ALVE|eukprot:Cvel_2069.t1-p1 / transcript=Cvel_2069.t1 / gene=Cvel_2069 / organism=Chromera_velia_CCMP2878 / gene_product=hypothetical protein / transcript_product=hypothetical protein / location=Cvel_scaffold80:1671-2435(-) / protein_length=158 / sequence_SO=supercontig / SO=protein_coding / is_pseudo=false
MEGLRKEVEEELQRTERNIFNQETRYLEETAKAQFGNVLAGWDPQDSGAVRKEEVRPDKRWFSLSSVSSPASRSQVQENSTDHQLESEKGHRGGVSVAAASGGSAALAAAAVFSSSSPPASRDPSDSAERIVPSSAPDCEPPATRGPTPVIKVCRLVC